MSSHRLLMAAALLVGVLAACTPSDTTRPTPTPTPTRTVAPSTSPHFELATYQYALQVKGKIRVATQEDNPPFSAKNANTGEWSGFDVAVARALARAIWGAAADPSAHIDWIPVNPATRLTTLTSGSADVVIQTLAVTDEAKAQVDLTDPYFHTTQRLLVKRANDQVKDVRDLADGTRTVCAQRGSSSEADLRAATNNGAKVLALDSYAACLQALQSGAAEVIAGNDVALATLVKTDADTMVVGAPYGDRHYAIGVKKSVNGDRQGFVTFLDGFVKELVSSGAWAKIYEQELAPITGEHKQAPD